jgi:hypothetical protein
VNSWSAMPPCKMGVRARPGNPAMRYQPHVCLRSLTRARTQVARPVVRTERLR